MTDDSLLYVPIELVGGPRDGQRIMWLAPAPPVIVIPLPPLFNQGVTCEPTAMPNAKDYVRVGEYKPRTDKDVHTWQHIRVCREALAESKGKILDYFLAKATDPREYVWCGEE